MSDLPETPSSGRPMDLNEIQRRVLGVLIEKCYTTPDQYPLTINAIVSGCNQKSNRHPVMQLSEGDIGNAIQELQHKTLAKYADVAPGARANRFEHTVTRCFPWSRKEQAILAELMLRGPQTVGEVRTRCDRMADMGDLNTVQNTLDDLAAQDPPYVVRMERAPGQSTVRYRHNFYGEDEIPSDAGRPVAASASAGPAVSGLESRIAELERRVAALESRLDGGGAETM